MVHLREDVLDRWVGYVVIIGFVFLALCSDVLFAVGACLPVVADTQVMEKIRFFYRLYLAVSSAFGQGLLQ